MAAAGVSAQDWLPDAPEKPLVVRVCSGCHDLDTAAGSRHTKDDWRGIVDAMIGRGAQASDEEASAIVKYLTVHVGQVNVNRADAAEIEAVASIPPAQSAAIVRFRGEHGELKDLDALKKIPGVDPALLDERKDRLTFK
jgi:competence ComEA-like helix-hairpin-helix protein